MLFRCSVALILKDDAHRDKRDKRRVKHSERGNRFE